jgi:hypothetical protein
VTLSEWWTYRPSDFLMFSASSHARLLEQFNHDFWPLHGLMLAVGLLLLGAVASPSSRAAAWAPIPLALVWGWVGSGFLWERFAEINTAASYLAVAFWVQAALLAVLPRREEPRPPRSATLQAAAIAAIAAAVLLWPLLAPLTGRTVFQADSFGMTPEPTALATVGWLLGARMRHKGLLAVIPLMALVLGLGMLWLLYGPGAAGIGR